MEPARRLTPDASMTGENLLGSAPSPHGPQHGNTVVLLTPAADIAAARHGPIAEPAGARNWPGLLERVRGAAHYMRKVEGRAQEQEFRVQELLEQVRADMQDAHARVQAAEQRTREIQAQANKLIQAAEERARVAQERTATVEGWLMQISETIDTEFVVEAANARKTAPDGDQDGNGAGLTEAHCVRDAGRVGRDEGSVMAAIDEAFWTALDAQIAAGRPGDDGSVPSAIFDGAAVADAGPAAERGARPVPARSDWTGVLDTIAAAKITSGHLRTELREQAAAHDALLLELRQARERARSLERLLAEAERQAETKACEATAETEAQVQAVQARADAQVQQAQERMRAAELRAEAAEDWLKRIEQASLALLPSAERAAA